MSWGIGFKDVGLSKVCVHCPWELQAERYFLILGFPQAMMLFKYNFKTIKQKNSLMLMGAEQSVTLPQTR
jgi:hypothetical protein